LGLGFFECVMSRTLSLTPAPKKLKTITEDDYMGVSQTDTPPKDSDNNNNNNSPVPSWLKNNMQEGLLKGASKLRPRPLMDPL